MPTQVLGDLLQGAARVAQWEEARFVPETSPYHGIGWPWCTCCEGIVVGAIESEIKVTTTYEPDPGDPEFESEVVGEWEAGSGAAFYDYTPLYPGGAPVRTLLTESQQWRFKLGINLATAFGEGFPTSQQLRVPYTLITRGDDSVVVSRTAGVGTISLGPGDTLAATSQISVDAPTEHGHTVGCLGELSHPAVYMRIDRTEAARWKVGFREYGPPSDPPKYYRKEAVSGSVEACAATGVEAKDYEGFQRYDSGGILEDERAADAVADGYFSELRGRRIPDMEEGLFFDSITGTELRRNLAHQCGEEEASGGVILTLSEEISTEEIEGAVDGEIEGAPTSADSGFESDEAEVLSWRHRAADRSFYGRAVAVWRMALDFSDMESVAFAGDAITTGVAATLVTTILATGGRTETPAAGSIASDAEPTEEGTDREAIAAEGTRIHVENVRATGTPALARATIYAWAATDAVAVFPG